MRTRAQLCHISSTLDNDVAAIVVQPTRAQDFWQRQQGFQRNIYSPGSLQFCGLAHLNIAPSFAPRSIHHHTRNLSTLNDPSTNVGADYTSVSSVLDQQVQEGNLRQDKAQMQLAKRLSRLQKALVGYDNAILFETEEESDDRKDDVDDDEKTDQVNKEANDEKPKNQKVKLQIPRGLYIHGPVGTGKTMLMNAFYANAPTTTLNENGSNSKKKRYHFHEFLAQVHQRIHQLKQQDLKEHGRNFAIDTSVSNNPIVKVGLEWSEQVSLLCLDEFQVTDIADALILSQLFGVLFRHGTVVVATSNRPPQDLYEGGLNRNYFLPFIDLLQHHCITHAIASPIDYRKVLSDRTSFFLTKGRDEEEDPQTAVDVMLQALVAESPGEPVVPTPMTLAVGFQRKLEIPLTYTAKPPTSSDDNATNVVASSLKVARFGFDELCDRELGAMDYRAVAHNFEMVILENIPVMDLEGHDVARRFITLIDELYEGDCALLCSTLEGADEGVTTPMDLFSGASETHGPSKETIQQKQEEEDKKKAVFMGVDVAQEGGLPVGALASVRELSFAFERSASRMFEMTSRPWWDRVLGFEAKE
ncbi:unnamed protein product [Cylindrotheca closterium]|uniref:AAA+ ATPase domain-containing protein n=1 Tax=Cylindrotheca closterium TaxID=2856 RepID=A0AAD2G4D4_9STRA|nr:unnamed protein product [Cylindrotheca closterium]